MDCNRVEDLLLDYVDGGLTLPEYLRVESHLASCYTCAETAAELRELEDGVAAACRHPAPVDRFGEFRALIAPSKPEAPAAAVALRPVNGRFRGWAVVATALVAAAAIESIHHEPRMAHDEQLSLESGWLNPERYAEDSLLRRLLEFRRVISDPFDVRLDLVRSAKPEMLMSAADAGAPSEVTSPAAFAGATPSP